MFQEIRPTWVFSLLSRVTPFRIYYFHYSWCYSCVIAVKCLTIFHSSVVYIFLTFVIIESVLGFWKYYESHWWGLFQKTWHRSFSIFVWVCTCILLSKVIPVRIYYIYFGNIVFNVDESTESGKWFNIIITKCYLLAHICRVCPSQKHAYIILTPLNPTLI